MKKIISTLFFVLIIHSNSYAVDGKGEIQLSEQVVNSFIDYIKGRTNKHGNSLYNKPAVFWVSTDGTRAYWWYCAANNCIDASSSREKKECENATGLICERFARGRYVRWDNGINPKGQAAKFKSKMSENDIKIKLKNLGFYNNTISINEFSNSDTKKNTNLNDKNLVEELNKLSNLFKSGVLTEDEFSKAKKKLLNQF